MRNLAQFAVSYLPSCGPASLMFAHAAAAFPPQLKQFCAAAENCPRNVSSSTQMNGRCCIVQRILFLRPVCSSRCGHVVHYVCCWVLHAMQLSQYVAEQTRLETINLFTPIVFCVIINYQPRHRKSAPAHLASPPDNARTHSATASPPSYIYRCSRVLLRLRWFAVQCLKD